MPCRRQLTSALIESCQEFSLNVSTAEGIERKRSAGGSACKCQLHGVPVCFLWALQRKTHNSDLSFQHWESNTGQINEQQVSIAPTTTPTLSLKEASNTLWLIWHDITHSPTSNHISLMRCLWIMGMYISILRAPKGCLKTLPVKCFIQRWNTNALWGWARSISAEYDRLYICCSCWSRLEHKGCTLNLKLIINVTSPDRGILISALCRSPRAHQRLLQGFSGEVTTGARWPI